ncbi:proline dehydrogenase [Natronococcus occultus SP4]|uniref:Proline dehydrogenase n=1 Tax=Natronococcus occultus SP4 TaxID=694430 RepID=L0K576_9EURY|nr:proline dehydrogenase [Natronococcus occultus SP4]
MIPPVASRFVAGETEAEALDRVRRLNEDGLGGMVNRLGTHHDDPWRVSADAAAYRELVAAIGETGLEGAVSVKPTQLGLDLGEDVFRRCLESVLAVASDRDVVVWLDMEERTTTDATLEAFEAFAPSYGDSGLGVCLQANLKRTPADLDRLADVPGRLRLVRGGAYDEPRSVAYRDPERMARAYRDVLERAFESFEGPIAVATHDLTIIEYATELGECHGTTLEVQMLMGVRPTVQRELASEYDVDQYVPYGSRWKRYFLNRLTENEHTLRVALRALLGRGDRASGAPSDRQYPITHGASAVDRRPRTAVARGSAGGRRSRRAARGRPRRSRHR